MSIDYAALRFLLDSYLDWAKAQPIPIVDAPAVDLHAVETAPWPLLGRDVRGAFVHLVGRGDFVALQVIDLPPNGATQMSRHLFDEAFYVLAGHGNIEIELDDGRRIDAGWRDRSLVAVPLNAPFRLVNGSTDQPARLVSINQLPVFMNLFRNERFLFDNPFPIPERMIAAADYSGQVARTKMSAHTAICETGYVPDLAALDLPEGADRGIGNRTLNLVLADSPLHANVSEMAPGTYKKAHWHGRGSHVIVVAGTGYTLTWPEDDIKSAPSRQDWRSGWAFAAADDVLHQHFNTGAEPVRYLTASLGSHRYPVQARKRAAKQNPTGSLHAGGSQLEYHEQDPVIHRMWAAELARAGVASAMDAYVDERGAGREA